MADVHSKEVRSKNMAAIKGKNTKPEMLVRKFLHAQGFRYRLHVKTCRESLILFCQNTKQSFLYMAVFGMDTKTANILQVPKTRTQWWLDKINGNIANDEKAFAALVKAGWRVIYIWECELKGSNQSRLFKLVNNLQH